MTCEPVRLIFSKERCSALNRVTPALLAYLHLFMCFWRGHEYVPFCHYFSTSLTKMLQL
jgi:hypothetical protein